MGGVNLPCSSRGLISADFRFEQSRNKLFETRMHCVIVVKTPSLLHPLTLRSNTVLFVLLGPTFLVDRYLCKWKIWEQSGPMDWCRGGVHDFCAILSVEERSIKPLLVPYFCLLPLKYDRDHNERVRGLAAMRLRLLSSEPRMLHFVHKSLLLLFFALQTTTFLMQQECSRQLQPPHQQSSMDTTSKPAQ